MRLCFFTIVILFYLQDLLLSQGLSDAQTHYLLEQAIDIDLNEVYGEGKWQQLDKIIGDKSMVMLGEFSHGAREVFLTRNDLIRYLHEEKGFDLILFEAGVGEVGFVDLKRNNLTAKQMTSCFFNIWRTDEFVDLMSYIDQKGILIGGFDIQRSGGNGFDLLLQEVLNEEVLPGRPYSDLESNFGRIQTLLRNRNMVYDSIAAPTLELMEEYSRLHHLLSGMKTEYSGEKEIILRTCENRMNYLKYMLAFVQDRNWRPRWTARDFHMAENIKWYLHEFYPGRKAIIIGHNFHLAKFNEKEEVAGEFLAREMKAQMVSIGFFGGKGYYADNSGKLEDMMPVDTTGLDIKHIAGLFDQRAILLEMPSDSSNAVKCFYEPLVVNDSFIDLNGSNTLILQKSFDVIIVLDAISAPQRKWFSAE